MSPGLELGARPIPSTGEISPMRCWAVLGSAGVAWLAFRRAETVQEVAVRYVTSGAHLVVDAAPGCELERGRVAFRVDGPDGRWAVIGIAMLELRDHRGAAPQPATLTPLTMVGYRSAS